MRRAAAPLEERLHGLDCELILLDRSADPRDDDELGTRDTACNLFRIRAFLLLGQYERRHPDRREGIGDVEIDLHPPEVHPRGRARSQPVVPDEPVEVVGIARPLRVELCGELLQHVAAAPSVALRRKAGQRLLALAFVEHALRPGVVEDQPLHAVGVRRGEDGARRSGLGDTEQGRSLAPDRVHDRAQVVHPRFDREAARAVREPDAAGVDDDEAPSLREPVAELGELRRLPERVEVGQEREQDEVRRPLADDLVRDRDVAAPRVADIRHLDPFT